MTQQTNSKAIQDEIIKLNALGYSSRLIASELLISKTSVNDFLVKQRLNANFAPTRKYLFLDIETAPSVTACFGRFKQNLGQANILEEGGWIISIAWRWMHQTSAQGLVLSPTEAMIADDSRLVEKLIELINDADVVIAHNCDNFDLPMIKSRIIIHSLPPLRKVKTIDTLKVARQMRFNSNKLDSLGEILGEGKKTETGGIKLWIECMAGVPKALKTMLEYNIDDVELLYRVYKRLQPHNVKPVNAGLFADPGLIVCPSCGSGSLDHTGHQHTNQSSFDEYTCNDCGAKSRMKSANKRVTLVN